MQIGITLISIVEGAYAGVAIGHLLEPFVSQFAVAAPYAEQISLSIVVTLITYFSLIVGELAPKIYCHTIRRTIGHCMCPWR